MRNGLPALCVAALPLFVWAADEVPVRCTEQWKDVASPSRFCYVMPPTDATAGIVLAINSDQSLETVDGRIEFTDTKGVRHQFLASTSVYQPFLTRVALTDGKIVELYHFDSLEGLAAYYLTDDTHAYRPFTNLPQYRLSVVPEGTYTLANGKTMQIGRYGAIFPEWPSDGFPDFILPPLPLSGRAEVVQ